jgi:hypothetical protein
VGLGFGEIKDQSEVESDGTDDNDGVEGRKGSLLTIRTRCYGKNWEKNEHAELIDKVEDDEVEALGADEE